MITRFCNRPVYHGQDRLHDLTQPPGDTVGDGHGDPTLRLIGHIALTSAAFA